MSLVSEHRWRRRFASASPILLAAGPVVLVPLLVALIWGNGPHGTAGQSTSVPISALLVGVLVSVWLLWQRCSSEYQKSTYDPTLALKYWDDFGSSEMYETRSRAAKALKDDKAKLADEAYSDPNIDDVLDLFEDLGFYLQGDQLTPEVAHQEFYYWVRGYYSAAKPYLENKQKKRPNQWKWIPVLFEATYEIEVEQRGKVEKLLSEKELESFLAEEMYDPEKKPKYRQKHN